MDLLSGYECMKIGLYEISLDSIRKLTDLGYNFAVDDIYEISCRNLRPPFNELMYILAS